jgi:hypothetical protein
MLLLQRVVVLLSVPEVLMLLMLSMHVLSVSATAAAVHCRG